MSEISPISERDFKPELSFKATRSSGPGGQNVNKVSSRIELRFDIQGSRLLQEEEKRMLLSKLTKRINKGGTLILVSQSERYQSENKRKVIAKFYRLIEKTLIPAKERRATLPTAASRMKRLEAKQIHSEKKARRKQALID